jgi:hypothetical protein
MPLDLDSVQSAKNAALQTAAALRLKISQTVTSTNRIPLRDELIEATTTEQDLDELEIRIQAGQSAMIHLSQPQIAELQGLSAKLDQQIVRGKLLNLTLSIAADVLESAVRVRDIVRGNM